MSSDESGAPLRAHMMQLTWGSMVSQAISVAADLGVVDALAAGPRRVDEIATTVGADASSLYRLLRALGDVGVVEELDGRRFATTPLGDLLRSDVADSLREWAIMVGRPFHRMAWTGLLGGVRTGEPAFEQVHGASCWDHVRDQAEDGRIIDAAMTVASSRSLAAIAGEYDFGAAGMVVDVGGGRGGLIAAILAANPGVRGVLFDLPHVVAGQIVEATGVGDRCEYIGGSFFEEVPAGGDVYVLANIIHDWDDERAAEILRNCGNAMKPGGRILLAEAVLPDTLEASPAKLMDLEMLVMNVRGARQRTATEYRELFTRAGLQMSGIVDRIGPFDLVEAVATERCG
ncbi:hydroxyneurosporene-O-methyltransferase [Pseudonocardia hierapolitana]|uniref:Hydroxyneurosporene-O-methyltransferase n=1 Tax=Pseudonocardia hierapolitana TaxID=1128676 RepID=A0A561SZV1_9PSEU|nr:methyltransferase [Pseudonocardia hierapolitana]TWF80396.1 hydroxyneurosporene-O-methyltransferase [Pseudonocardia hierapolitana]